MIPQTIHSKPHHLPGTISVDRGVKESLGEEVKKTRREGEVGGDGDRAERGDLIGDIFNTDVYCGIESFKKFAKGRKIDLRKEKLERKPKISDKLHGKFERDIDHSGLENSGSEMAFCDNITLNAIRPGGEMSDESDSVESYERKNVSEKERKEKLLVCGGECDKKCDKIGDRKGREEKPDARVTGEREKCCWRNVASAGRCIRPSSTTSSSSISTLLLMLEKIVVMVLLLGVFSAVTNVPVICAESMSFDKDVDPVFLEPVPNVTVAVGRDASLTCAVDHLGLHKVAWIHLDRQMIVSIHNHVITRQPRFTVTHDSHKTWTLQVTRVMEEDRGHYMCQVNTKPMISQTGFLQVVVPPNIVDKVSSKSNIVVREKDNVTLVCRGEGFPLPQIKWRREDSQPIETSDGRKVHQLDGPNLVLHQVSRTHMGAYLCIATNGVPPSVSKRITLDVEFAPQMHVPNQLVGSPLGTEVHLECFVEAHPRAITYWEFLDAMVMNSSRVTTRTVEDRYKIHMTLTIGDLQDSDFGMYKCISKNSIAETDGSITLNKTLRPTSPPQIMLHGYDDEDNPYRNRGRQGRKEQHRKQQEDTRRRIQEEEEKRREVEEARRRAKETERQRLEHDFDRGQRNEQATRVTHTQSGSTSLIFGEAVLLTRCVLALSLLLSWQIHI